MRACVHGVRRAARVWDGQEVPHGPRVAREAWCGPQAVANQLSRDDEMKRTAAGAMKGRRPGATPRTVQGPPQAVGPLRVHKVRGWGEIEGRAAQMCGPLPGPTRANWGTRGQRASSAHLGTEASIDRQAPKAQAGCCERVMRGRRSAIPRRRSVIRSIEHPQTVSKRTALTHRARARWRSAGAQREQRQRRHRGS